MRLTRPATALVLLLALAAPAHAATSHSLEVRVVGVSDGDTITVLDSNHLQRKIRLAGIDAPEKGQPFGDRARQSLARWVFEQTVHIEWSKVDRYGRMVAVVRLAPPGACAASPCPATLDVNLAQIAAGFAWHYRQYENEQSKQERMSYDIAEQHAREQKLGLWQDPNPVPPWEWRHGSPLKQHEGSTTGPVRKSRNDICHDPSMATYLSVQHFTSFHTLEECVSSGGRLPKGPGG